MNKKPTPDLNRTNARLSDVGRRRFEKDKSRAKKDRRKYLKNDPADY